MLSATVPALLVTAKPTKAIHLPAAQHCKSNASSATATWWPMSVSKGLS